MRIRLVVLVLCLIVGPFWTIAASAADSPVCRTLASRLLPEKISRDWVGEMPEQDGEGDRYLGHWIRYTEFCFDCTRARYILGSGVAVFEGEEATLHQNDLYLADADYFLSGEWKETARLGNVDRSEQARGDDRIDALSSALLFMEYGKRADTFFLASRDSRIVQHLPRYGIRGSNMRDWYTCQSCRKDVPPFTYDLAQDLRYTRLARYPGGLAVVTTRPRVVVALLSATSITYHECPIEIGRQIEHRSTYKE